ncbi:MAG: helix-turn-helix transcriptional regulator [Kiritimatiellia bacterium]
MRIQDCHHDEAALTEMGRRLAQLRIDRELTQAELAKRAGVGKRTLERLEAGETTQTRTLIRILRELALLEKLEVVLPEPEARPSHAVHKVEDLPKRAARSRSGKQADGEWKWGDES